MPYIRSYTYIHDYTQVLLAWDWISMQALCAIQAQGINKLKSLKPLKTFSCGFPRQNPTKIIDLFMRKVCVSILSYSLLTNMDGWTDIDEI